MQPCLAPADAAASWTAWPVVAAAAAAVAAAAGVDLLVDVHGDEELPHVFVAGLNGIPSWGPRMEALQHAFCEAYKRHAPEFQTQYGYPTDAPGAANLTLCSKQVGWGVGGSGRLHARRIAHTCTLRVLTRCMHTVARGGGHAIWPGTTPSYGVPLPSLALH